MWAGMLGHLKAEEFQVKKDNRCIRFVYSYTHRHSYHIKWDYLQHWWVRQWDCLWGSEPRHEYRAKGLNTMHLTTLSNKASIQTYLSRRTCWLLRRTACGNLWTVVWMYQEWAKQQPSLVKKFRLKQVEMLISILRLQSLYNLHLLEQPSADS